ncbi:MAG: uracil-DNA glycosylase [Candidatus Helarchaeota archaeon]
MTTQKKQACHWYSVCPMKRYFEAGLIDAKWIQNYCMQNGKNCVRKKMEEEGAFHPDNMLPNGEIRKDLPT